MSLNCILCQDDLDATIKGVMMFIGCPKKGTKDACNHVFCHVCYNQQVLVCEIECCDAHVYVCVCVCLSVCLCPFLV